MLSLPGATRVQAKRWSLHARYPCILVGVGLVRLLYIHLLPLLLLLLRHASIVVSHARCMVKILAGCWPTLLLWYLTGLLARPGEHRG